MAYSRAFPCNLMCDRLHHLPMKSAVQAMKLMNEIEADVGGTVVKWVAEDAGNIAPGDVICVIEP